MRAQGSGVPLMGRRNPRHAGPGAGGAEIPAAGCTAIAEGKGEEADRWAPIGRERKGEGCTWAGLAVRERGERERGWSSGWEGVGPRAKGFWAASFPSSFPFSFSTLKPFKPFLLNSNKFEFKPNTNKTMHQHECTSKLTL
jgi:hypothetical protein